MALWRYGLKNQLVFWIDPRHNPSKLTAPKAIYRIASG